MQTWALRAAILLLLASTAIAGHLARVEAREPAQPSQAATHYEYKQLADTSLEALLPAVNAFVGPGGEWALVEIWTPAQVGGSYWYAVLKRAY